MSAPSVQELYAPKSLCFGCGPANALGLRIRSVPGSGPGDELVCDWTPEPHHEAFPGILNGGIIGSLLDCHSNWTAARHLMLKRKLSSPPCTVTADYAVRFLKPTPAGGAVRLTARVVESLDDRAVIDAELTAAGALTATCRGGFVAVRSGHPAFHRW